MYNYRTLIKKDEQGIIHFYAFLSESLTEINYPKLFNPEITMDDIKKYIDKMFTTPVSLEGLELLDVTLTL